jgi:hypothetical protein
MSDLMVTKVTLGSGKVVYLREPTVDDMESAGQIAGKIAGNNSAQMGMIVQKEILKRCLVQINEKKLGRAEKEGINSLFSLREYTQVIKIISQLSGVGEDEGNFKMELVSFGNN